MASLNVGIIEFTSEEAAQIVINSLRERAIHAEMTVFRMLKFGNKYISEAWDTYDERVERKKVWDGIVAKWLNNGEASNV